MGSPVVSRATRAAPCPVCGSPSKGCSRTEDGLHMCRGEARQGWRRITRTADAAGFEHYRAEDDPPPDRNGRHKPEPAPPPQKDWQGIASRFAKALTPDLRAALAGKLGLPVDSFERFPLVGYAGQEDAGPIFSFPECDGRGRVVGISLRYGDGSKKMMTGSRRGLTVPKGWDAGAGPVFLAEGATCPAAGTLCGLSMVGRPSNTGGIGDLADLLRDFPKERAVYVLGENDRKPDGSWPGKEGAERTAGELSKRLNRQVKILYPPAGFKDVRAWVAERLADCGDAVDYTAIGKELVAAFQGTEKPKRFQFMTAAEVDAAVYETVELIEGVLAQGEPAAVAGPSKSLKTSFSMDAAVSLASGKPFLGQFRVPNRVRVAFVSGESGRPSLQSLARRVCRSKGFTLASLEDRLNLCFDLPTLSDPAIMADFAEGLSATRPDVVFLDPLYLSLGSTDPRNLFEMGNALRVASEILGAGGATVVICHHANRQLAPGEAMDLRHLAFTGLEQYVRQWLLIARAEAYQDDGNHEMILRAGGSAGHSGRWAVRVEEGRTTDPGGRKWEVTVTSPDEAKADRVAERETKKKDEARQRMRSEETSVLNAVDKAVEGGHPAITIRQIRDHCPTFSHAKAKEVVGRLIEDGQLEEVEYEKPQGNGAKVSVAGFRRPVLSGDK